MSELTPPNKKTTSVPLRKETVRVTLKSPPAPPKPLSSVPAPPAPPAGVTPPPTVRLKTGLPASGGLTPAPTIKLNTGSAAPGTVSLATPKPTVQLASGAAKPAAERAVSPAQPASPPKPLPTVPLQMTQNLGVNNQQPGQTIQTMEVSGEQIPKSDTGATIFSLIALFAALIILGIQIMTANIWINIDPDTQDPTEAGWSRLLEF